MLFLLMSPQQLSTLIHLCCIKVVIMMLLEGNVSSGKPTVIFNAFFLFSMKEGDLAFINDVDGPFKEAMYYCCIFFNL